jgi:hypothetical protein
MYRRIIRGVVAPVFGLTVMAASSTIFFAGQSPVPGPLPDSGRQELSLFQTQGEPQGTDAAASPAQAEKGAHMDHKPKHGGLFFMSLDNAHHLEGALLPPATFRIYLYDDHTKPLKAEETRKTSGTVQIGDSDDAPKIGFAPGKKKETIEAKLGDAVKLPINLTVLLRLPGMSEDSKPELFNFTFDKFTDEHGPGSCRPMPSMPNMHC